MAGEFIEISIAKDEMTRYNRYDLLLRAIRKGLSSLGVSDVSFSDIDERDGRLIFEIRRAGLKVDRAGQNMSECPHCDGHSMPLPDDWLDKDGCYQASDMKATCPECGQSWVMTIQGEGRTPIVKEA